MTRKEKILIFALLVQFGLWISCSGSVEQPSFVSIYPKDSDTANANNVNADESESGSKQGSVTPKLKSFSLGAGNELRLVFSGEITKVSAYAYKASDKSQKIDCSVEAISSNAENQDKSSGENLSIYKVIPATTFSIGEKFVIEGSAEGAGNEALDFSLPFGAVNSKPAKLLLSEVRLGDTKKLGYIRFKVIESGNLSGLTLFMPANSWAKATEYSFPVAEVKKGEEVAYHWFSPPDSSVVDEINSDVICSNKFAHSDARDFWGKFKKFTPKRSNVIVLKSSSDGKVEDAVLFLNPKEDAWTNEALESMAQEAVDGKLWLPDAKPTSAFNLNITPSKKIVRKDVSNLKHSAVDWELVTDKRK